MNDMNMSRSKQKYPQYFEKTVEPDEEEEASSGGWSPT